MSSRSGRVLMATLLAGLVGAFAFPASVDAAPKTNSLSGNAENSTFGFNGSIISNDDGSAVRGTFQVQSSGGNVTVDATCLRVGAVPGGRLASTAGIVKASSDPAVPVGSGIRVEAFDSDTPTPPDGLSFVALPEPPGPGDCSVPSSVPSFITKGDLTIRVGG